MIRMLMWKEWREQRWKLALGSLMLVGFTAVALRTRVIPDVGVLAMSFALGGLLLPILVGMDLVAGERESGTLECLLNLPVRPWKVLGVKLAMGVAVCVGPMLAACVVTLLMAGGREQSSSLFLRLYASATGFGVCLLLWMTAFGIRQRTEARAAVVGMAVVFAWYAWATAIFASRVVNPVKKGAADLLMLPNPLCVAFPIIQTHRTVEFLAVQAVVAALLFVWAVRRFARPGRTNK